MGALVLLVVLALSGCSDTSTGAPTDKKERRPGGMSEEIWKIYSGTESGVADEAKDKSPPSKDKPPESKDKPPEKK